ncbi:Fur family transcriptional regulator [Lacrimispora saccharolytica]|uniref:Fur family transcriptional regulator n=1 Tax=Lacrimispora saccharolytica TaxID=84030 RepID=UPI003A7F16EC
MICLSENLLWYQEILSNHGIKNTKQKELILIELMNSSCHLTAEEIYQHLKEEKIGLATVYRSLKIFVKLGIVKVIPIGGINYYELKIFSRKPLHIHFKCSNCNAMVDIDDVDINLDYIKLNQRVEQKKGLEVKDANITLLGLCKKCKEELASNAN